MLTVTEDQSILDQRGNILFYSSDQFLRDIVDGNHCFICGADPTLVPFNDEHVIPDWILRKYALHDKRIVLPGGSELLYGQYKVPCYTDCNSRLGDIFEKPISTLFSKGYSAVVEHLRTDGPLLIFTWLSLIFLKTHLKDRMLPINRDRRVKPIAISELYEWPELHHIHCLARSFYTGTELSATAFGSILVFPSKATAALDDFDYADYYPGRAILLRLGEILVIAVLNDACAALNVLSEDLRKITGPLSSLQCRELLAHFAYANVLLESRPKFYTHCDKGKKALTISADMPKLLETGDFIPADFGEVLHSILSSCIDVVPFPEPGKVREHIRKGRWTFLFDNNGQFVKNSL